MLQARQGKIGCVFWLPEAGSKCPGTGARNESECHQTCFPDGYVRLMIDGRETGHWHMVRLGSKQWVLCDLGQAWFKSGICLPDNCWLQLIEHIFKFVDMIMSRKQIPPETFGRTVFLSDLSLLPLKPVSKTG
jgi:hypothetical protein